MLLRRAICRLLVLVALFGVFGQSLAYAQPMTVGATSGAETVVTMADCSEMVMAPSTRDEQPCQGLTLDCIARMGCVAGSILPNPLLAIVERLTYMRVYYAFPTPYAHGITIQPEIFPPIT